MMLRHALVGAMALALAPPALADGAPSRCIAAGIPRSAVAEHGGRWIALTDAQRAFITGIYAMNPQTPAGLPYGDAAVLATVPGHPGGMVFFVDGDKACTPMPVPKELVDMLGDVAAGVVNHETGGL